MNNQERIARNAELSRLADMERNRAAFLQRETQTPLVAHNVAQHLDNAKSYDAQRLALYN